MERFAMELIFEREKLWNAMQIVGNVASSRNTLPILANVLIKTTGDQIQLAATDLEVGVKYVVQGEITEPGSITVPAKKLTDIVRELSANTASGEPSKVKIKTLSNDRIEIDCENAKFRILGLSDEEFPSLPEIKENFISLDASNLCKMVQRTAFAVSTEETRHFLNGIYFRINNESVKLVATDGRRLAVAVADAPEQKMNKEIGVIVPTKAVSNLLRTFTNDQQIKIALLENQIAFANDDMTLISRLIEGEYPDYEAIVTPAVSNEIIMTANTEQLLSVVRRVSLLANPKTPSVRMESNANANSTSHEAELSVLANTPELGEAQEKMYVNLDGGNIEIAFNAKFVMDVLRNIQADEVLFKFRDSLSPVLVKPSEDDNYFCVIMPMRL
jgi:DNA polymerase-3 subunit beta